MSDPHSALIYAMMLVSASDADMTDAELAHMGEDLRYLPVFRDFDLSRLPDITAACSRLLSDTEGLERILDYIAINLPTRLRETAYALACDIAVADGKASQEELRVLELLRHRLDVDRLCAAAIERGARARHATL